MNKKIFTFGECLSYFLEKKNISISRLAELTQSKSRNSIQRILKNQTSIVVVENFCNKLIENHALSLSLLEKNQLRESVEVSRAGKEFFHSRQIILNLFKSFSPLPISAKLHVIGSNNAEMSSVERLFESYADYASIDFLIFDAPHVELSEALLSFIQSAKNPNIMINHIIAIDSRASNCARIFTSIYKLLNYENYNVCYTSSLASESPTATSTRSILSDLVVVHKKTGDGTYFTDLISFHKNHCVTLLSNIDGSHLYDFYKELFIEQLQQCQQVRKSYECVDPIDSVIEICEYCLSFEKISAEFLIKQNMSYQMIPLEILYSMLADADFFGLPEDNPKIQQLIKICIDRFNNYYHHEKLKVNIFTKHGLSDFVQHCELTDHLYAFRQFTKEEVKATLQHILNQLNTNPSFKVLLLDEDCSIGSMEFDYYENHMLSVFDSNAGYNENFYEGAITAMPIINVFDDFIKNELIPHHTLAENETTHYIQSLINSID